MSVAQDLLQLARSDPRTALPEIDRILAQDGSLSPTDRSIILRAGGLAARSIGDLARSRLYLEEALATAQEADDEERAIEAQLTLAGNRFLAGEAKEAVRDLDRLSPQGQVLRARVRYQTATILARTGNLSEAISRFDRALRNVREAGDRRMAAMVLKNRAMTRILLGDHLGAEADITESHAIFTDLGIALEKAYTLHNMGLVAALSGDYPTAFERFGEAEHAIADLAESEWEVQAGHIQALIAAGLHMEAIEMAGSAVAELTAANFQIDRAEALLLLAEAQASAGLTMSASTSATEATETFASQGRDAFAALAELTHLRLDPGRGGAQRAARIARSLATAGMSDVALRAEVAAADLLRDRRRAAARLAELAPRARRADFATRLEHRASLARALADSSEKAAAARVAANGATLVEDNQALLGLSDLRVAARRASRAIHDVGMEMAGAASDNRRLFDWMERSAVASSLQRRVTPVDDDELRSLITRLAVLDREKSHDLLRRRELEALIRARARVVAGSSRTGRASVEELRRHRGDRVVLTLADISGRLHGLRLTHRLRRFDLGPTGRVLELIEAIHHTLAMAASTPGTPTGVEALLAELDEILIRPTGVGATPLLVLAHGRLANAPWSGLPSRVGMPTTVARSATSWMQSTQSRARERRHVTVVTGPGLDHARAEATAVAEAHGAEVMAQDETIDGMSRLLDGSGIVHAVCHGELRTDNPLFSSLRLHQGHLPAYWFQQLHIPPETMVLSACHLGAVVGGGGGAVVGFADALRSSGVGTVIASTAPVPDSATTVAMMRSLHEAIAAGDPPSEALAASHGAIDDELLRPLYAAAFTCLGAG